MACDPDAVFAPQQEARIREIVREDNKRIALGGFADLDLDVFGTRRAAAALDDLAKRGRPDA